MIGRVRQVTGHARLLLHQPSVARFALLVAMVGAFGLAALLAPRPGLEQIRDAVDRLGPGAPVAAIVGGALLLVALVPRTFITLAWGAVFGPIHGAGYTLAAALLAAAAGFAVGRLLGRGFVSERVRGDQRTPRRGVRERAAAPGRRPSRLARLDHWFTRQNVLGVITVRLLPIAGFGLVSYGYGTTGARLLPFLTGTVLAAMPSAFGYAAVGAAVVSPGEPHWLSVTPAFLGLVATGVLLAKSVRAERRLRSERRHLRAEQGWSGPPKH